MQFTVSGNVLDLTPANLIIAGWTGRNQEAIQHHIDELAALGVKPPSATPLFYRVAASLLTTADEIQAVGPADAGAGEFDPVDEAGVSSDGERSATADCGTASAT